MWLLVTVFVHQMPLLILILVLFILWLDGALIQSSSLEGLWQVLASESINKVDRALAHLHHSPPQAVSAAHLIQLT